MARPKNSEPVPSLRLKNGIWRIRWQWGGEWYELSTGYHESAKASADSARMEVFFALRGEKDWPGWANGIPAVANWMSRDGAAREGSGKEITSQEVIAKFRDYYSSFSRPEEVADRLRPIVLLAEKYDLLALTQAQASSFFSSLAESSPPRYFSDRLREIMAGRTMTRKEIIVAIEDAGMKVSRPRLAVALANRSIFDLIADPGHHKTGKYRAKNEKRALSPRTRNKYKIAFNMFYSWAVKQGFIKQNPFADIRNVREQKNAEIIWLTREERDQITAAADTLPCRAAVWIAIYAGLRLGEITRLRWEDIDLAGRWLHVKKSKTGKSRRVPVSGALLAVLQDNAKKSGPVVAHWQGERPAVKAESDLRLLAKSLPELAGKIGWNIFRHTFASLLAQTGKVSVDQISALMGNTPEVCRRHYAHLIPDAVERTGIDLID